MLGIPVLGDRSLDQLGQILRGLQQTHAETLGVSTAVVAIVLACRRFAPRVPGPLLAVVAAVAASAAFDFSARGIRVIGPLPGGLPRLGLASLGLERPDRAASRGGFVLPDDRRPERGDGASLRGAPSRRARRERGSRRPRGGECGRSALGHVRGERQPDADRDGRALRRHAASSRRSPPSRSSRWCCSCSPGRSSTCRSACSGRSCSRSRSASSTCAACAPSGARAPASTGWRSPPRRSWSGSASSRESCWRWRSRCCAT